MINSAIKKKNVDAVFCWIVAEAFDSAVLTASDHDIIYFNWHCHEVAMSIKGQHQKPLLYFYDQLFMFR